MSGDTTDTGAGAALLRIIGRLKAAHARRSAKTVVLSILLAGTEGIGVVMLIPLLALVGLPSGDSARWLELPLLRELGLSTNIYAALGMFLALLILRQSVVFWHRLALTQVALDFSHRLRTDFFAALVDAQWKYFSAGTAHRHSQILTSEAARSGNTTLQLFSLVGSIIVALIQIAIAALLSVTFTLAALGGLIVFSAFFRNKVRTSAELGVKLTQQNEALYAITSNLLPLLRTTKMAGNSDELNSRFRGSSLAINASLLGHTRNQTATLVKTQLLAAVALSAALVVGVQFLALDALSASILVLIFARLTPLLAQAWGLMHELAHNLAAVSYSLENIALWAGRNKNLSAGIAASIEPPRQSIELSAIAGGYAGTDADPFLRDISIQLPVGSTLLVNGPTGAGKSTLADIIVGLLTPTSGSIILDGHALAPNQLAAWRSRIGYVEQAAAVFTGTLRENLLWGSGQVDPDWFTRVLEACEVADFIDGVAGGLDGSIGEAGAMLSGGQKQRVAIARELMRKPALLVLDEATSGLDEAVENKVLRQIADLDPYLTMILISHRPSSERFADWVVELENGRIRRSAPATEPMHGPSQRARA